MCSRRQCIFKPATGESQSLNSFLVILKAIQLNIHIGETLLTFADFAQTVIFADFLYLSLISPEDNCIENERSTKQRWAGGGAQRIVLCVNEPKQMGARITRARSAIETHQS
jgi:hypothetical protein